ncbi:MAG: iron-sulfur cluster repair di-iron protein [Saprospiraceae bacterium]|jgi:regulator of cell morphogenesis and NO signaling|nr:iron-sulfur cluster repair di-iron protein [Saprospiraceae bacterium]
MNININSVIGDIVSKNYKTAEVFRHYGVDFCCKGNRIIKDLSDSGKIDLEKLLNDLESVTSSSTDAIIEYNTWPLDLLADYIEKKYHRYIEEKIPVITEYLAKTCKVHGHGFNELYQIHDLFVASSEDLLHHMMKEEKILFPYIRKMVANERQGFSHKSPAFGSVKNPISMMMSEHMNEGDRYRQIATLSNNYTPPPNACNTFMVTYALLQEFEENLHQHIHLENNILFPNAINFEETLIYRLN